MKGLSLFSGIGGLDLAAMSVGIEPVAMCEIEPFPVQILKKRFPGVPVLPDVKKVNGHDYRRTVDIIFGGFPCQDLSIAGRRAGLLDADGNTTRSGLWFEMLRIISEARPRFVVAENVRGAINAALDVVQSGLEGEGYKVRTILLPASAVGAPHQRERIFIVGMRQDVADAYAQGLQGGGSHGYSDREGQKPDDEQPDGRGSSYVWRTPDANMTRGAISEEKYLEREQRGMPNALNYQVAHVERNWPTCTASGNERTGSTQYREGSMHSANLGQIDDLAERSAGSGVKGQLNPDWVEQLMGYPEGWTDPDCETPGPWMGWPARPGEPQYEYEHPPAIASDEKNLREDDKVIEREKLRGKFCDFGAMITKGVGNERNDLA